MGATDVLFRGSARIGHKPLFSDIAIQISAGVWTGLLGPSGVGKSSILRLIAGLGTHIDFRGRIQNARGESIRSSVSMMAQEDLLLPWADVNRNVALGAKLRGEKANPEQVEALLRSVGLGGCGKQYPSELSGGQRQRVALARTMAEKKPLILLDEPFSALDAKTRSEMQELTAEKLAGKTVFLVTHDPAEAARLCGNIYLMSHGGCSFVESLPPPFPKNYDDGEVVQLQSSLLRTIRDLPA